MMKNSLVYTVLMMGVAYQSQAETLKVGDQGTKVAISATIIAPPPCKVNDNNKIEIDFEKVGVNRIDGINYKKKIDYQVSCEDPGEMRQLAMKVSGAAASFDAKLLKTTSTGLAIKFENESGQISLNTPVNFIYGQTPELYAVLVKDSTVKLTSGDFTSSATLKIDYL